MAFSLTLKQTEQIKVMLKAKHVMSYGGSRSGKTFGIVRAIIIRALKTRSRHVMLRQTFNSIKTSIFMDTFPKVMDIAFPNVPYRTNKTDYFATLGDKSEIHFGGLDDGKRVEKILGREFSTLFFNECSQIPYSSVQVALSRLAEKNTLRKLVLYDANPPSSSHWTYSLFELGLNPIDLEPVLNKEDYASILMNPIDNLVNIDEDYLNVLKAMSERDRNRFMLGLYSDDSDGQVYYSFSMQRHVRETIKVSGTTYIFMDFNVSPMTATIAQIINNEIHIHDEIFLEVGDTFKMCNALKEKGINGTVIPDSTGQNRKTSGQSDFDILKQNGFQIPYVFNPAVSDRVNNVNRLFQEDRIIINPKCKKLINDFQKVVWKNNSIDQSGANKMLSHISDGVGYGAWYHFPIGLKSKPISISKYR